MKNKEEIEKFFKYILDKVEDCYKNEVEMAIKDFNKETTLEVPVQEQYAKPNEISIRATDFEKIIALIGVIIGQIDFTEKFKIELNYDPKHPRVKMTCFKSEK